LGAFDRLLFGCLGLLSGLMSEILGLFASSVAEVVRSLGNGWVIGESDSGIEGLGFGKIV
jgi:hypothetical protein